MVDDGFYDWVFKLELLISVYVFLVWFVGIVVVCVGCCMVGSDQFDVILYGVGGYGFLLQNIVDLVVMGVCLVMVYQIIVSCNVDLQKLVVFIVGVSQIGEVNNVILDNGIFKFNLCWYEKLVCEQMFDVIKWEINGIVRVVGVVDDKMLEYIFKGYFELVYNDEVLVEQVQ